MTNTELYAAYLAGEYDGELPKPRPIRVEMYMAALCGLDVGELPLPRPIRTEMFLYELAKNGGAGGGGSDEDVLEITDCDYLFAGTARKGQFVEIMEMVPYIATARYMFQEQSYLYDSNLLDHLLTDEFYEKLSHCQNCYGTFHNCKNIKKFPSVDFLQDGFWACRMFYNASNLQTVGDISCPSVAGSSAFDSVFYGASALESVGIISVGDGTGIVEAGGMFTGCKNLKNIGGLHFKPKNAQNLFNGCSSLETLPDLDLSSCTVIASICSNCSSLKGTVNLGPIASCSNLSSAFAYCKALEAIVDLCVKASGTVNGNSAFPVGTASSPAALKRLTFSEDSAFTGMSSFSVKYCSFERDGMLALFESLPDISDSTAASSYRTLTITGNPCVTGTLADGTACETLTDADRAIATGKGWTLVE